MKKLLTILFAVLFVVALSSLSMAQPTLAPAPEGDLDAQVAVADVADGCPCAMPCFYGPHRPFAPRAYAPYFANPYRPYPPMGCPPMACPPRPVCPPQPVCPPPVAECDPCAYPGYGPGYGYGPYRAPIRNFLSRVFAPRYGYGYGGYGGYPYGYGY